MATVVGTPNNDTLTGTSEADLISGLEGDDLIGGGDGNDTLDGGPGNDTLLGGAGVDNLLGGTGDDTIWFSIEDGTIDGGDGIDTARALGNDVVAISLETWHVERLFAGDNSNQIIGYTLSTLPYEVHGGGGDDTINGGASGDVLMGDSGRDGIWGLSGIDSIFGGDGNDTLAGNSGVDNLWGGDGDDQIYFEVEDWVVDGGPGFDYAIHGEWFGPGSTATLSSKSVSFDLGYHNVEGFIGGTAGELIFSTGSTAIIVRANDGRDIVTGGDGNDTLEGGNGIDQLSGGRGDDEIRFGFDDWVVSGGEGTDTARNMFNFPNGAFDLGYHQFEIYYGSAAHETISTNGATGAISVDAGAGNDLITGSTFADVLGGNSGNDVIDGGDGADTLGGGGGSDRLTGGMGADFMFGEADPDSYIYRGPAEGGDTIIGFETAALRGTNGDRIEIQRAGFDASLPLGALDPSRFVAGTTPALAAGQFLFDAATGDLFWDGDGTGAGGAQLMATLLGLSNLAAWDFVLV